MESPAWLPRREVKPPPTSTEAGVAADAPPLENSAGNNANSSCSIPAPTILDLVRFRCSLTRILNAVRDNLRNDPRYKSVKHEDREVFFNEYLSELKAAEGKAERDARGKREEQLSSTSVHDNLKERERELRKQKEIEEQEMERVRVKVRRNEAVASFQALLVETIKDPQASWTESKPWLEKDPQGRATNPDLDPSDIEKLFREHIKMLHERCTNVFKDLLAEVIIAEAAAQKTEDGKTALDSWSTAKRLLKPDSHFASDIYRSHFLWMVRPPSIPPMTSGERRDPSVIRPLKVASRIVGTKPSTRNMRGFHVAFVAPDNGMGEEA